MLGDTQRCDARGPDADDGGAPPVCASVGVGDHHGDGGAAECGDCVAQRAGRCVGVLGQQPRAVGPGAVDAGRRQLISEVVPGDDRPALAGHEVGAGFSEDQFHDLGRFTGARGQVEGSRAGRHTREIDKPPLGDRDDLRGDNDHIAVLQIRGLSGQDIRNQARKIIAAGDGGERLQGERAEGAGGAHEMRLRVEWAVRTPNSRVWAAASVRGRRRRPVRSLALGGLSGDPQLPAPSGIVATWSHVIVLACASAVTSTR